MENKKLDELSLEATKKADDLLKRSKKLKRDFEKLLNDVEEINEKNKTQGTKKSTRK